MADPKIRFDVEANATGAAEVERLAQTLTKLDDAVDPSLAARAEAAARALREIGEQQAAITAFDRLQTETEAAARDVAAAGEALDKLRTNLDGVAEPTAAQAGRLQKLEDALKRSKGALEAKSAALGEARGKLDAFGVPLDQVTGKQAELREQLQATRQEVQALGQTATTAQGFERLASSTEDARVAVARTRAELDAYAAKLAGLDEISAEQAQALQSLGAAAAKAGADLERASAAQAAAAQQTRAAGVDIDAVTASQQRARAAALAAAEASRTAAAAQLSAAQSAAEAARSQSSAISAGTRQYTALVAATEDARIAVLRTDTELARYRATLAAGEAPTRAQAQALAQLGAAAKQAQGQFLDAATAQARATDEMRAAGVDVQGMVNAQQQARAATLATAEAANRAANAARQQGDAGADAARRQTAGAQQVVGGLNDVGNSLRNLQGLVGSVLGGQLLAGQVGDVLRTADAYSNLAARIKIATGEGAAFDAAFQGVFDIATRTSSAIESTGTLFTQITRAGKELNISQRDALALTETINQAVQVSGASAASSDAALQQLIQGLQSGVLRGEEFNSVMEQAPRLAMALADGLGVTTGQLREQANAGALSSQVVIKALQGQAAVVANEFNQLPPTVGRALTNLSTEWTRYVGEVDKANGVSAAAASAISALAGNLDTLGALLFSAGKAAAAYTAVRLAATFLANAQAATAAAAAKTQETAATVANSAAQTTNTTATVANTAAKRANAAAATAAGGAADGAAVGAGRLAGILSTLRTFTLLGIVTNLQEIGTWLGESVAKWQGYGKAIEDAESKAKALEQAQRDMAAQDAAIAQARQKAADATLGLNTQSQALIGAFEGVRKEGGTTADALAKVSKEAQLSDLTGIRNMGTALDALALRGKISGEQVRAALAGALKGEDLARFDAQARAAFDGGEQGARRLGAALAAIDTEALRRAGTSADQIRIGFNAASTTAINDVDALSAAVDRLGVRNTETGRAMSGALDKALEASGTEQAVQAVIDRMKTLGQQGFISGDQLAEGLGRARAKLDEIRPGVNSLNEALSTFGLKSREELQATADKMSASWEQIRGSTAVSVADQMQAFEQYKAAAVAANGGIVPSALKVEEAILRTKSAAISAASGMTQLGDAGVSAGIRTAESFQTAEEIMNRVSAKFKTGAGADGGQAGAIGNRGTIDGRSVTGSDRGERLAGQNAVDAGGYFSVQQKLQNGTLTEADRPLVEALAAAAKQNSEMVASASRLSAGAISFEGQRSVADQQAVAQRALESLAGRGAAPGQAEGFGQVPRKVVTQQAQAETQTKAPTQKEAAQPSKTVLVRFDLGGGRQAEVNTTDQQSADALLGVLEQAARSMGR